MACVRRLIVVALLGLGLAACTGVTRHPPPADRVEAAQPLGIPGLRFWGDVVQPREFDAVFARHAARLRARFAADFAAGRTPTLHYLALSGGGSDGAFGVGILNAWTAAGTRPEFAGVSGVSTGSLIAPFAFLGPDYDPVVRDLYLNITTAELVTFEVVSGLLSGMALTSTAGLARKIAEHITPEFLARIAAEHRRGRVLLMGTTNLDYGRPVIWDMGAIAASGHPGALDLFRMVMRASAAIPVAFPPVLIPVFTPDGRRYDEMHVDGGASSQVMLVSPQVPIAALTRRELGHDLDRQLWIIVNNNVIGRYEPVQPRVFPIAGAALSSLIRGSATGDLYKLYLIAQRDRMRFRATWIPESMSCVSNQQFDPAYMRCLFDFAEREFGGGRIWSDVPPYFARAPEAALAAAPSRVRR